MSPGLVDADVCMVASIPTLHKGFKPDHYAFLGNSPPTPYLTQHFAVSVNKLTS